MSRSFKHPKTGIYWFRKAVPPDLRLAVGKREELRSLGTREPEEAKRKFALVQVEVEAKWASLRRGSVSLSEREAHDLARPVHDAWLDAHRENQSQQTVWNTETGAKLWPRVTYLEDGSRVPTIADSAKTAYLEYWCAEQAKKLLADKGLKVDIDSMGRVDCKSESLSRHDSEIMDGGRIESRQRGSFGRSRLRLRYAQHDGEPAEGSGLHDGRITDLRSTAATPAMTRAAVAGTGEEQPLVACRAI